MKSSSHSVGVGDESLSLSLSFSLALAEGPETAGVAELLGPGLLPRGRTCPRQFQTYFNIHISLSLSLPTSPCAGEPGSEASERARERETLALAHLFIFRALPVVSILHSFSLFPLAGVNCQGIASEVFCAAWIL